MQCDLRPFWLRYFTCRSVVNWCSLSLEKLLTMDTFMFLDCCPDFPFYPREFWFLPFLCPPISRTKLWGIGYTTHCIALPEAPDILPSLTPLDVSQLWPMPENRTSSIPQSPSPSTFPSIFCFALELTITLFSYWRAATFTALTCKTHLYLK